MNILNNIRKYFSKHRVFCGRCVYYDGLSSEKCMHSKNMKLIISPAFKTKVQQSVNIVNKKNNCKLFVKKGKMVP